MSDDNGIVFGKCPFCGGTLWATPRGEHGQMCQVVCNNGGKCTEKNLTWGWGYTPEEAKHEAEQRFLRLWNAICEDHDERAVADWVEYEDNVARGIVRNAKEITDQNKAYQARVAELERRSRRQRELLRDAEVRLTEGFLKPETGEDVEIYEAACTVLVKRISSALGGE